MTTLHLAHTAPKLAFLIALLCAVAMQSRSAVAQSLANPPQGTPGSQLVFGGTSSFSSGTQPPAGQMRSGAYFDRQQNYSISLGPTEPDDDQVEQYWLELGGSAYNQHQLNARIGLGYSPTPGVGISVGSYFDVNASATTSYGKYQAGGYAQPQPSRQARITDSGSFLNDAGLAASLSYMPFEDIWIGLHGSVSRNLATTPADDGTLDGIDAMLGLTATYKIEF